MERWPRRKAQRYGEPMNPITRLIESALIHFKSDGQTPNMTSGDNPPFNVQDVAASQFEQASPLRPENLHPYDNDPNAFPIFEKDVATTPEQPSPGYDHDRFASTFIDSSPLSANSTAFSSQDQYASIFRDDIALKSNVAGTTLGSIHTEPLKEKGSDRTIYYIYHRKDQKQHFILSPEPDPVLEKRFPRMKALRQKRQEEKEYEKARAEGAQQPPEEDGYFVHKPIIGFHHPPRTLRRGVHKSGTPVCLIYNSSFWRRWRLLFGDGLSVPGVIDPRGAVSYRHHTPQRDRGELDLKGYKVRGWRMWGETGKDYVRQVNRKRKTARLEDHDIRRQVDHISITGERAKAEEAVYLDWNSPFSRNTRRYSFKYAGIDFYWKGTGSVKETRACGIFIRYNHLKLVARVPIDEGDEEPPWLIRTESKVIRGPRRVTTDKTRNSLREITLAKYTSSVATKKAGTLELYDEAIYRFVQEFIIQRGNECAGTELGQDIRSVKHMRLYDLFVATAMCMIIAEWQKRETIRKIIAALAAEGGGGAGN
jgi:hypothetical protein